MIVSVILAVLLTLGALAFVAAPLLRGRMRDRTRASRDSEEELLAARLEKDAAIQLLSDLEHDRSTGKLDDEDYLLQKAGAQERAVEALKRLDALGIAESSDGKPIEQWIREERLRLEKEARR